jgi:hypothetical protein
VDVDAFRAWLRRFDRARCGRRRGDAVTKREKWIITNEDGTMALAVVAMRRPAEWVPIEDATGYYPSRADAFASCYGRSDGARPLRIA